MTKKSRRNSQLPPLKISVMKHVLKLTEKVSWNHQRVKNIVVLTVKSFTSREIWRNIVKRSKNGANVHLWFDEKNVSFSFSSFLPLRFYVKSTLPKLENKVDDTYFLPFKFFVKSTLLQLHSVEKYCKTRSRSENFVKSTLIWQNKWWFSCKNCDRVLLYFSTLN